MNKTQLLLFLLCAFHFIAPAQDAAENTKEPWVKLNGFVRNDLFFDSRENATGVNGLFLFYPLNEQILTDGKDVHANPSLTMLAITSRLNTTFRTPDVLNAKVSGRIEFDFTLYSGATGARLRHAYGQMTWTNTQLLIGQTWIPAFVENCIPTVVGLATGAPYQEFARNPQIRVTQKFGKCSLLAAVVSQMDYASPGPEGPSPVYMRRAVVPEIDLGLSYNSRHFLVGVLGSTKTLKPRNQTTSVHGDFTTSETITSFNIKGYAKYFTEKLELKASATYGGNFYENLMQGGYGVSKIDTLTGKEQYTPFRGIYSWINFVYGKKWQGSLTAGYGKNLGTSEALHPRQIIFGRALDIDRMYRIVPSVFYNIGKFQLALEYELNTAYYGELNLNNGRVENSNPITSHRISLATSFFF